MKFVVGAKTTFVPTMLATPLVGLTLVIVSVPPGVCTRSLTSGLKVFVVFYAMM